MFTAPPTAALTSQPRKGIGARVAGGFSRLGAALRSVVAGGPRRPQSGPESRTAPDADRPHADSPPAARQARAPRQPSRARKGGLARLFGRRRAMAAVPEQSRELPDFDFSDEAFPELSPEARAFFNTPLEECDPAMLGVVLEALAELIAGSMTPQEGMRDARDVFLALSSRMEAVSGEAGHAPPAALPEVAAAPADLAATAAIDPQACRRPGASDPRRGRRSSAAARPGAQPSTRELAGPAPRRTQPRRHPTRLTLHRAPRPRPAPRPISPPRRQPGRRHQAFRSAAPARKTHARRTAAASRHATRGGGYSATGRGSQREASYCHGGTFYSAADM